MTNEENTINQLRERIQYLEKEIERLNKFRVWAKKANKLISLLRGSSMKNVSQKAKEVFTEYWDIEKHKIKENEPRT